ncbi:MAG: phosphatase PAP2 family protein [Nocardioides sp.]
MVTDTQARYLAERAQLLAHPGAADAHAQVAAFASLHIEGLGDVLARLAGWAPRWLSRTLGIFVALTAVATVQIGWHFVVDDLAGLLIAALAVVAARWTVPGARARAVPPELTRATGSRPAAAGP